MNKKITENGLPKDPIGQDIKQVVRHYLVVLNLKKMWFSKKSQFNFIYEKQKIVALLRKFKCKVIVNIKKYTTFATELRKAQFIHNNH